MAGAGLIPIKRRIKSVTSTQKITKAMGLVATSKLRKSREKLEVNEKYYNSFNAVIRDISKNIEEYSIYTHGNKSKNKLYIALTSDSGLCGAFNVNVVNKLLEVVADNKESSAIITVGQKGRMYLNRTKLETTAEFVDIPDLPTLTEAKTIAYKALSMYEKGEVGEVYVVYAKFISTVKQVVEVEKILPLGYESRSAEDHFIKFEPSIEFMIDNIAHTYLMQKLLNFMLNSKASEQGSRMSAMDGATRNANELLDKLKLKFNRIRQGAITQEISEIVGGAEAQK